MKKLAAYISGALIAGLVATELAHIALLTTASSTPDRTSGRTQAVLIAPEVSHSASYITTPQILLLVGLGSVVVLCFAALMVLNVLERLRASR